jgi:hypothetical protein
MVCSLLLHRCTSFSCIGNSGAIRSFQLIFFKINLWPYKQTIKSSPWWYAQNGIDLHFNTVRISAPDNTIYYGPKTDRIDAVYGRKCRVFTTFTVRFRIVNDAVLIDLGVKETVSSMIENFFSFLLTLPVELVYRILDYLDELPILCSIRNICTHLGNVGYMQLLSLSFIKLTHHQPSILDNRIRRPLYFFYTYITGKIYMHKRQ